MEVIEDIKPLPSPENVSGVVYDWENNRRFIFTKDSLVNQLQRECTKVCSSFDHIFKEDLKELSERLSSIPPIVAHGLLKASRDEDELTETLGILLTNATHTLISSVQILRSGFRLQSGFLIRSAIETCATVFHLLSYPDDYVNFMKGTFKSTSAISTANKMLPIFGQVWGYLSNNLIHINVVHTDIYPLHTYKDKSDKPATVAIGMIGMGIWILHVTAELAFIRNENPTCWRVLQPGQYQFIPPTEEIMDWIKQTLAL